MPLLAAALLSVALMPQPSLRPIEAPMPPIAAFPTEPPPEIDALSWMVYAVDEQAELGSLDPDRQRAPASITKLLTAMLAVRNGDPREAITISPNADATPIGYVGQPDIRTGEVWLMEELLDNIMVQSGNDAAVALAEYVSGTVDDFVILMNETAAALGMENTSFENPSGLDDTGHVSTARDLVTLGVASLEEPDVLRAARVKYVTFDPGGRPLEVESTNRLLGVYPGFYGLKTGDTANAGQTLLGYLESSHERIISVVLGSRTRRVDTRELLTWAAGRLGPRDHFFAAASGSEIEALFPDWYRPVMAAAGSLQVAPSTIGRTPGEEAVLESLLTLVPEVLGGSGS